MTLTASTKPSGERASTRNRGLTTFAPCPCREFTQSCYIQVTTQTVIPSSTRTSCDGAYCCSTGSSGSSRCSSNSGCSHSLRCNEPPVATTSSCKPRQMAKMGMRLSSAALINAMLRRSRPDRRQAHRRFHHIGAAAHCWDYRKINTIEFRQKLFK